MNLYDYKELVVWQKAMELARKIYLITKKLPKEEMFGMTSQMRRASVSIPSNIAEGHSRFSTKEYKQFLSIAHGSNAELETQLILCANIGYLPAGEVEPLLSDCFEITKMIYKIIDTLDKKS